MIDERIEQARQLHQHGSFPQAIAGYESVLAEDPGRADVWHLKGMAEHQSGQLDAAGRSAERAIAAGGEQPMFLLLEAGVLHDRGDLAGAEARLVKVVQARPDWAAPLLDLGTVRMDASQPAAALEAFRAAAAIDGVNLRAWNGTGLALLSLDRIDEALKAFNHALSINPRYAFAHYNLARIHNLRLENAKALEHAQMAVRLEPGLVDAHLLIGDVFRRKRDLQSTVNAYAAGVRAAPNSAKARNALAEVLAESGRFPEAKAEFTAIAQRFPSSLKAALGANLLLPQVYPSHEYLGACRADYTAGLERLHAEAGRFRFARGELALAEARWTNFYLAYQGRDDAALQRRYGEFLKSVLEPAVPALFAPRPRRSGGERIRVGFLSHFFFNCTVGRYFASWITRLDRRRFEPIVYYTNEWIAEDTKTIAAGADRFRHLPGRPLHTLAQEVAADELDILVYPELGMHPETFTLASLRLAPVQCAGWGHPDTPGHPSIDWFISCAAMEPENAQAHYNEKLALLPGLGTHYGVPATNETATRADFALPEDKTLYLVPQSLFKIHPDNDERIAEVMARDPDGMLVLFASNHDVQTDVFASRLAKSFERRKMHLADRARFVVPGIPHGAYLALNRLCDVMLDTVHWSGGNTSLDALSSGIPVVTQPGAFMRGRQSGAMLAGLKVPELIAADEESWVSTAVRLGLDRDLRRALSERIVANAGEIFGRDEPVRALEDFFERVR